MKKKFFEFDLVTVILCIYWVITMLLFLNSPLLLFFISGIGSIVLSIVLMLISDYIEKRRCSQLDKSGKV